jgi:hypothetical protein
LHSTLSVEHRHEVLVIACKQRQEYLHAKKIMRRTIFTV